MRATTWTSPRGSPRCTGPSSTKPTPSTIFVPGSTGGCWSSCGQRSGCRRSCDGCGRAVSRSWRRFAPRRPSVDAFHQVLARIGLDAAERYGFALAGGYAVQAAGFLQRPSEDIDLFTVWERRGGLVNPPPGHPLATPPAGFYGGGPRPRLPLTPPTPSPRRA